MAVSYDGLAFRVLLDGDGRLPRATRQEDKTLLYTATVLIDPDDITGFEDRISYDVTIAPALGNVGGRITVGTGPGAATCTVPTRGGEERTGSAILLALAPLTPFHAGGDFRAEITLLFLARPT